MLLHTVSNVIHNILISLSLVVAGLGPQFPRLVEVDDKFVMVAYSPVPVAYSPVPGNTGLQELGSVPQTISSAATSSKLNKTWYILWQIAYPVHIFAAHYLRESRYSKNGLCERLGVSEILLDFAVDRGIRQDTDPTFNGFISAYLGSNPRCRRNEKPKKRQGGKKKKNCSEDAKSKKPQSKYNLRSKTQHPYI